MTPRAHKASLSPHDHLNGWREWAEEVEGVQEPCPQGCVIFLREQGLMFQVENGSGKSYRKLGQTGSHREKMN